MLETAGEGALTYGGGLGFEGLREQLAERSARELGLAAGADEFMLVNGAAGGIATVCDAMLDPGDVVLVAAPTFSGSVRTMHGHRARVVALPTDADGLDTAVLPRCACRGPRYSECASHRCGSRGVRGELAILTSSLL